MSKNLYLNPLTYDIELENFGLRFTKNDTEFFSQKIENRLKTFFGELFTNQLIGIDYFRDVLKKQSDLQFINGIFKNEILSINGIDKIISFSSSYEGASREYSVIFEVSASTTSGTQIVSGNFNVEV